MSNYTIFGSTTGGGATLSTVLKNISNTTLPNDEQLLVVEDDGVVNATPISTYGKTLLNSISLAQLKADLDGSPTAVSVNDNGVGEINMTIDGDANLRLQIKDTETNVYNEMKIRPTSGNDYLSISQNGNQSKLKASGAGGVKLESNSEATGITIAGATTTLNSPTLNIFNTSVYCNTGTTLFTQGIRVNSVSYNHDIGASTKRFNNVYSNINDSSYYKISDGGNISMNDQVMLRFLDGSNYNLPNTYLFQLNSGSKTRFSENGFTNNFLEINTDTHQINIDVPLYIGEIRFGGVTSKKIEYFGNNYSTGVQGSTLYFRSDLNYAFYKGGSHSNSALDPGTGGSKLLTIEDDVMKTNHVRPLTDDDYALGTSALRYTEVYATNGSIQTSDIRQKTDISLLHNGLDIINGLKPVSYKWKTGVRTHLGLIAQDVEQTCLRNTAVYIHDKETDRKGLRYTELIAVIIKALQELDAKFNKLGSDGIIVKEVYKAEKQQNDFSNIKKLLKSMGKPEQEKPVILENLKYEQQIESLNIKHKIINDKYTSVLGQIEELKTILQTKPEQEEEEEPDIESDNGSSILDIIQQRLYELEKRCNKNENKLKRITTIVNKLVK